MSWRHFVVFLPALMLVASPVSAHRLDELLQATTISLGSDSATLQISLTPGVGVAAQVLADLDENGDGLLSPAEKEAQAGWVLKDITVSIDDQAASPHLVWSSYPTVQQIKDGVGNIVLNLSVDMEGSEGNHTLGLENRYRDDISVYLVNALQPDTAAIQIDGQERSHDQASYRLDFTAGAATNSAGLSQDELTGADRTATGIQFFWEGVHHILGGYDHLLFIAALVLGASTLWDLVKVVTAFTLAHSITLTLAALQLVHVPAAIVEPLIAASIVVVAVQNIISPERSRGWSRLLIAFGFGLVHGLGFAGGLLDLMNQMPTPTILVAIAGFSLGIEAGNQLVLLPLFGLLKAARAMQRRVSKSGSYLLVQQIGSGLVSVAGAFYLFAALGGV